SCGQCYALSLSSFAHLGTLLASIVRHLVPPRLPHLDHVLQAFSQQLPVVEVIRPAFGAGDNHSPRALGFEHRAHGTQVFEVGLDTFTLVGSERSREALLVVPFARAGALIIQRIVRAHGFVPRLRSLPPPGPPRRPASGEMCGTTPRTEGRWPHPVPSLGPGSTRRRASRGSGSCGSEARRSSSRWCR